MLDLKSAIKIVVDYANERWSEKHNKEYVFDSAAPIIEEESLWFIPFIEKKEEEIEAWIGAAKGCIVDKETGEFFQPGSAYPLEMWIWGFKLGFRGKHLDFKILKVNDREKAIELMDKLGPQYLLKNTDGSLGKINYYSKDEIAKKLEKLPCVFKSQGFTIMLWAIKEIMEKNILEFEVTPSQFKYGKHYGELIEEKFIQ